MLSLDRPARLFAHVGLVGKAERAQNRIGKARHLGDVGLSQARAQATSGNAAAYAGSERGFALLLVIWVLALLSLLAAGLAADSSAEIRMARNRADFAQARALADAGVTLALAWLMEPNANTRWHADGGERTLRYGGGTITIAIQDEGGKVNLNAAPLDLVAGVLDKIGVEPDERTALVAGIDARRRAFAPQTVFLGPATFNAPFAAVSELRLVPGVTRRTYELIQPFVTVYSESATINPLTAPREVLLGVPGISPQDVEFFLPAREEAANAQPDADLPKLSGVDRYVHIGNVSAVTITAKAVTDSGASFAREAVIAHGALATPAQPYQVLEWGQAFAPLDAEQMTPDE
jgi:general secretion pathway protein K